MASGVGELVRAAGLLINRRVPPNTVEYLLLQHSYAPFHWTPPKGHVDPGEDEFTAALRETREESGLSPTDLSIDPDFRWEQHYSTEKGPKRVVYWLASLKAEPEVKLSHEHKDFCWAPLPRALELAGYDEARKMLVAAEKYLTGLKGEGQSETGKLKETPQ